MYMNIEIEWPVENKVPPVVFHTVLQDWKEKNIGIN